MVSDVYQLYVTEKDVGVLDGCLFNVFRYVFDIIHFVQFFKFHLIADQLIFLFFIYSFCPTHKIYTFA
jgi:hypothetical protein